MWTLVIWCHWMCSVPMVLTLLIRTIISLMYPKQTFMLVMMVTVLWRSHQGTQTTYLQSNLRFDVIQLISTYLYRVSRRDSSLDLFGLGIFRFSPGNDGNQGDCDSANVDNYDCCDDDDDNNDDDKRGYLHDNMETCHNMKLNGNEGRHLVWAEPDAMSGIQSDPMNMRPNMMVTLKEATRRFCIRALITSSYPLLLPTIAWGWRGAWQRRSWQWWRWKE